MTTTIERTRPPWLRTSAIATVVALTVIVLVLSVAEAGDTELSAPEAVLLGIVEGITEYLPVSSTGHLLMTQELLGLADTPESKDASDSYAIAIQFGAIVAVAALYRTRIANTLVGLTQPSSTPSGAAARALTFALVIAFTPAALLGFVTSDLIKEHLFSPTSIAVAWLVGGIAIIVFSRNHRPGTRALEEMTRRDALIIGAAQILALWPGTSRSLVTIIAAVLVGLKLQAAVEFSFLLGLATLTAATLYETLDNGQAIIDTYGYLTPFIGFVAALVSAAAAVTWLVDYLQRRGLEAFGWYRIVIALVTFLLVGTVI